MIYNKSIPVALFVFNRPHLTAKVFERIRAARPEKLLVIADGPRPARPDDVQLCRATREIVGSPDWPCQLMTNFADENLGCRRRVSSGLDWAFQECSEAIILEDDCIPCPSFFGFCSEMLQHYRKDPRIVHIGGANFQDGKHRGEASYFFSRYPHTWGWASWRRAWRHYDVSISTWPEAREQAWLQSVLDEPREIKYWENIFERLHSAMIDTWDYQWVYICWRLGGLSILPNENLVTNIGVGPDATHLRDGHSTLGIPTRELVDFTHPVGMERDEEADRYTFEHHIAGRKEPASGSVLLTIRNILGLRTRINRLLAGTFRRE